VRASVRYFHSPDVDLNDPPQAMSEEVGYLIQMMIGPTDGPGEESFNVVVCTPAWLEGRVREDGPVVGRHHLVVESFDWPRVRLYLNELIDELEGENWTDVATKIGRIGKWEFEEYRP